VRRILWDDREDNIEWILGYSVGRCGVDSSDSGWGSVTGPCERGTEPLDSVRGGEFLEYLPDYQLLKRSCAA
jgi:hypothetical protein